MEHKESINSETCAEGKLITKGWSHLPIMKEVTEDSNDDQLIKLIDSFYKS